MRNKAIVYFIILAALFLSCGSTSGGSNTVGIPNTANMPNNADIPNNARAFFESGNIHAVRGYFDLAIADFTEAIRLNPNFASAFNHRGMTHQERGNLDLAIADFTEAIRIDPNFQFAYYNLGNAHRMRIERDNQVAANLLLPAPRPTQPAQAPRIDTRGQGVIRVTSEFRTYRDETRTRLHYVPAVIGLSSSSGFQVTSPGGIETYTYTVRVRVTGDSNLPFLILENGRETFRGVTPIRVTNFDPGVTYTIVWTGRNGARRERTFVIPTTRPFTREIHID